MAKVAIVILNWNGQKMLAKYLSGVVEYSRQDAEVWVADNSSTDGSMHLLETQYPQVKTIVLEQNFGFAEGYNQALKQIEAEYYVLLNSDVEVTHHWLTPLIEFMDSHPQVAACQPKLLAEYDKDSFEYAGACGGFLDKYGYPFCRGRIFETVERDNGQYDYQQEVLWATGACMMIRAKDYWDVCELGAGLVPLNHVDDGSDADDENDDKQKEDGNFLATVFQCTDEQFPFCPEIEKLEYAEDANQSECSDDE